MAQAHVQQLVVEVSPVGMEGALSVQDAACKRKYRVRKRNGKRKHRQDKCNDGIELEHTDDRDRCQNIAQQQRTGVAHEYLRRIEVIRDKAQASAAERGEDNCDIDVCIGHKKRHDKHRQRRDGGNAAGKSVKPIDEVDRVCDADYPQYGHRNGEDADGHGLLARYQQRI